MAYCVYCGKKLEEGEICNCRNLQNNQNFQGSQTTQSNQSNQSSQSSQNTQNGQNNQSFQNNQNSHGYQNFQNDQTAQGNANMNGNWQAQNQNGYNQAYQENAQQYQESFNQAKQVSGLYLQQLFGAFIGIFKRPVEEGRTFAASGNAQLGIGFLAIQAILSSFFALIICTKVNNIGRMATSYFGGSSDFFSYPKVLLLSIVGSLIISFAFAGLLYVGVLLFRGKTTFGKIICVVAVRSVGISLFIALSVIVGFLNIGWGILIFILSWVVGLIFMIPVIQGGVEFNSNRLPYMIILIALLSIVVFFIWCRISLPMYASELVDQVENVIDNIGDLDNLF